MDKERLASIETFEHILSYSFRDKALIDTALTHRSYMNESQSGSVSDNERLEFLGDAVLELCVSRMLMDQFPDADEGQLSRMRASIVNENSLARIAESFGTGRFLLLGKGEEASGGRMKTSILSNTVEAIVAAVYLDCGFDETFAFLERLFFPLVDACRGTLSFRDYKTSLQEICQGRFKVMPRYRLVGESGPEHDKIFKVRLFISDIVSTTGIGKNKKEAEQQAARKALEELEEMTPDCDTA
jgi:ribonuclease-3